MNASSRASNQFARAGRMRASAVLETGGRTISPTLTSRNGIIGLRGRGAAPVTGLHSRSGSFILRTRS